jgi:hypothetical protein
MDVQLPSKHYKSVYIGLLDKILDSCAVLSETLFWKLNDVISTAS